MNQFFYVMMNERQKFNNQAGTGRFQMALALTLLGETKVSLNGNDINNLSAEKAHALLIYLVVESDRSHRREVLAEMLWPEKPEGYGRNNLKQNLSLLRTALGDRQALEPYIISSHRDLQFNTDSDFQVDLLEFEDLTKRVRRHCHSSEETCEKCAALLDHAANLYKDDFLVDFSLADSPEFSEWVLTRRESSKRMMADILGRLINCYREKGDFKAGAKYAKDLVDLEPWNESSHRTLMYLLAASGKRSAALKQFLLCEAMLASEFNVKPSPNTISLYKNIQKWEPFLGNQESISKELSEFSTGKQVTEIVQEETSHLRYWVMGSLSISILILIWFGTTKWEPLNLSEIFFLSNNSDTNLPILTNPDDLAADPIQDSDNHAQEVKMYLQGNNPNLALAAIYDQTRGSDWIQKDGWLGGSSPCTWHGITCQDNRIIEIRLPKNNLKGNLPPEIGDMHKIKVLDLSNNFLNGPIPPEIGYLVNLEYLNLEGNFEIRGEIPPEIGNLLNLEELILSSAAAGGSLLDGELPSEIGELIKLDKLIIEDTLIQGSIPPQLGNLSTLSVLSLSQNNLSGPIPDELYDLSKLRSLDLWANQNLSGTISPKIGHLTHLDFLNISHNQFSGNLPSELGTLINLDWIGLHDNTFRGSLPISLTELNPRVFQYENTNLCEPSDPLYQEWLDTILDVSRTAVLCDDNSADTIGSTLFPDDNDPYVISPEQACPPRESILYSEDFQDGQAQGWPEIEYRTQNWDIVSDPENPENLVVQNPGLYDSGSYLKDKYFYDAVWRADYYIIGKPEFIFIWHHVGEPYENKTGTVHSSDYNFAFMFDGTHFYRFAYPISDAVLLGIPTSIKSRVWHSIEISTFQGKVEVWLDGHELLTYQDPDPLPGGMMGLGLWTSKSDDSMVYFDNLRVCELNAPFIAGYSNE